MTIHQKSKNRSGPQAFNPKTESEVQSELAETVKDGLALLDHQQNAIISATSHETTASPGTLLSDRVAALAASLDVPPADEEGRYDPDAFVAAVQRQHDALMRLEQKLSQQAAGQRARERDLQRREADLAFAEKRVKGREALVALGTKPWWRW